MGNFNFIEIFLRHNDNMDEAAKEIKFEMDTEFGGEWNCVVGRDFDSDISTMPKGDEMHKGEDL